MGAFRGFARHTGTYLPWRRRLACQSPQTIPEISYFLKNQPSTLLTFLGAIFSTRCGSSPPPKNIYIYTFLGFVTTGGFHLMVNTILALPQSSTSRLLYSNGSVMTLWQRRSSGDGGLPQLWTNAPMSYNILDRRKYAT